jgi:hypothetical protein
MRARMGIGVISLLIVQTVYRRRQVSPPVDNLTHRFFDGSQHFFYCKDR